MPSTDPMNSHPGAPIRLRGPAEIAAAVPVLLGYHPDGDTVVMVCLNRHGSALRLGPLAGIPLPSHPTVAEAFVYGTDQLARRPVAVWVLRRR